MGTWGSRALPLIALAALLAALALPAAATPATSHRSASLSSLDAGVLQQLNKVRAEHHLAPLALSAALTASSAQHSREMAVDGYFEHASHDGTVFWKRIDRWYPQAGFHYWSVGENLLWASPDVDPAAALKLWMNSPEHRANILSPRWHQIGVAAVHVADAPGTFQGQPVTIITTDFGVRQ
jgi:uncharacterized protein YkwD